MFFSFETINLKIKRRKIKFTSYIFFYGSNWSINLNNIKKNPINILKNL